MGSCWSAFVVGGGSAHTFLKILGDYIMCCWTYPVHKGELQNMSKHVKTATTPYGPRIGSVGDCVNTEAGKFTVRLAEYANVDAPSTLSLTGIRRLADFHIWLHRRRKPGGRSWMQRRHLQNSAFWNCSGKHPRRPPRLGRRNPKRRRSRRRCV